MQKYSNPRNFDDYDLYCISDATSPGGDGFLVDGDDDDPCFAADASADDGLLLLLPLL